MQHIMYSKLVILDSILSAHNVGSIFRTSDGAGVEYIYICGYTPCPNDRFGRVQREILKTSLGASASVPWTRVVSGEEFGLFQKLKRDGYTIVAVEQAPEAVQLSEFTVPKKVAYILGNEIEGVSKEFLEVADVILEIEMAGIKESLNVSVCAGIVLFRSQ